jgi:hypothetical protein
MRLAVCIGCGCDDHHTCELGVFGDVPCRWLCVNRPKGLGVCTCCHGLDWRNQAALRSDPDFSAQRFAELLEAIYDRDEGLRWYERRQQVLNGKTPRELVAAGNIHRVRRAINEIRDGVLL